MLRPGHFIALAALALLTIGVVMVNSADMAVRRVDALQTSAPAITAGSILLSRSTVYMGLALLAMLVGAMVPVRRYARRLSEGGPGLYAVLGVAVVAIVAVCALVYVPGFGRPVNGANRWLSLPIPGLGDALSVQPSEIAKWTLVPVTAWYCVAAGPRLTEFWRGLVPVLAGVGAVSAFIILEDLGTGVLILGVACLMLLAGGARFTHFMVFSPLAAVGLAYAVLSSGYRMKRILAFVDPYADPRGIGYHTVQSLLAIAGGEGWGRGLGHGLQKFGYLPEDRTDFLFPVICEELGVAGGAMVCALFAGLAWAGYGVMKRERDPLLRLLVLGISATVSLQAVMNLLVVTGLAPTKGIALPLLSSGGTGWILTSFSLGLVIAVDRPGRAAGANAPDSPATADPSAAVPA